MRSNFVYYKRKGRKFEYRPRMVPKSRVTKIKETDTVRRRKRNHSTSTIDRTVDHRLEERMDQVEGDLEGYVQEVGDRSTPDNPHHPSIDTRRPAGGMEREPTTTHAMSYLGKS
jgi:hypothetical protein